MLSRTNVCRTKDLEPVAPTPAQRSAFVNVCCFWKRKNGLAFLDDKRPSSGMLMHDWNNISNENFGKD